MIHLTSIDDPFRRPDLYYSAVGAMKRADAMGLLPEDQTFRTLDEDTMKQILDYIARAKIGRGLYLEFAELRGRDAVKLAKLFEQLNEALEESPAPTYEWPHLARILTVEPLAKLLNISPSSIRRYKEHARSTPDGVANRLHFVALVVGDLAGAYNDIGIRRWFDRPRTPLANRAPRDLLVGEWNPGDPGPQQVRELAHSLAAAPAT